MKSYEKPELKVISFKAQEDFALSEYYYEAKNDNGVTYNVSLFCLSSNTGSGTEVG